MIALVTSLTTEPITRLYRQFRRLPEEMLPRNQQAKTDYFFESLCEHSGQDLSLLFKQWQVPVSSEAYWRVSEKPTGIPAGYIMMAFNDSWPSGNNPGTATADTSHRLCPTGGDAFPMLRLKLRSSELSVFPAPARTYSSVLTFGEPRGDFAVTLSLFTDGFSAKPQSGGFWLKPVLQADWCYQQSVRRCW